MNLLQSYLCNVCTEQKCDFSLSSVGVITLNMFKSKPAPLKPGWLLLASHSFFLSLMEELKWDFAAEECALVQSAHRVSQFVKLSLGGFLKTQAGWNPSIAV